MTPTADAAHRYQRWSGRLRRGRSTWLAIVTAGIRAAFKMSRMPILLMSSFGFVIGSCAIFYVLTLLESVAGTPEARGLFDFVKTFLGVDLSNAQRIKEFREVLWRATFLLMIKGQFVWVMIIVARVGPGLIANDLKTRAMPIYFSKPITPLTYLVGKWMIVAVFIALVSLAPNLLSLILGTLLTGGLETWGRTLRLAWDLIVCGLGLAVFAGTIILALSSITADRRYVAVAWLAVCVLSLATQSILDKTLPPDVTKGFLGTIALSRDLTVLAEWQFDMRAAWDAAPLPDEARRRPLVVNLEAWRPALVLLALTVAAAAYCYRRIVRFSRSATSV
jgi:ABC-type transport system involved in multi-copper enzyme maturation permease subunit